MSDVKKQLEQLKRDLETKKFREGEAKGLTETIGDEIKRQLAPAIEGMGKELTRNVSKAVTDAIKNLSVNVPETQMPEIPAPVVNVPAPIVKLPPPVVNVPAPVVNIPETKFPEPLPFPTEFSLRGVNKLEPLPVMMMDAKGKPAQFGSGGAVGGRGDFFTIKDIQNSTGGSIIDADGNLKIAGSFSATVEPFATYYASDAVGSVNIVESITLETRQVSGAVHSVIVNGIFGSTATNVVNPDGRLKVELPTGSSGLTDTELRAAHLDVQQLSGAIDSVYVTGVAASFFADVENPDGRLKVELPVLGLTDTELRAAHLDVQQVSGAVDSVNVVSSIETKQVSGFADSVFVTGAADSFFAYEVMTSNKTAKADGADIRPKADDLGRAVTRPVQVRDLIQTAYATLNTNTETTLLSASAGSFHDLIWIKFSNTSTGAITIDLRDGTAGNIVDTWEVPANASQGIAMPVPYPQGNIGNNWTVDFNDADVSNTTVYVSALFSREA